MSRALVPSEVDYQPSLQYLAAVPLDFLAVTIAHSRAKPHA